jgi:hypothetical protein
VVERDWRRTKGLRAEALCRCLGEILFNTKAGTGAPKYIVANDNIDITYIRERVWVFATRNHPGSRGKVVFNDEKTNLLVAYIDNA